MTTLPDHEDLITKLDHQLGNVKQHMEKAVQVRPWWQRLLFPMFGLVLILIALASLLTPLPLSLLALIGFPLLFCYRRRSEARARHWMLFHIERLRAWLRKRRIHG